MTIKSWQEVLSPLPNTAFFNIARHYLGPIATPFHKPDIIARLIAFFERSDVLQRIREFVDKTDAKILTCTAFCPGIPEAKLKCLMEDLQHIAFQEALANLEERLLITAKIDRSKGRCYYLTPLGGHLQEYGLIAPEVILGESTGEIKTPSHQWFNDNFLNAALSFLFESHSLFRADGAWRKKPYKMLKERFPILFEEKGEDERLNLAGRILLNLELVRIEDGKLVFRPETWRSFEALEPERRQQLIITAAILRKGITPLQAANIGVALEKILPPGRAFNPGGLNTLIRIVSGMSRPMSPRIIKHIIISLIQLNFLTCGENGGLGRPCLSQTSLRPNPLTLTPSGDIVSYPGLPLFSSLAFAAELVNCQIASSYRLNKTRFIAALDVGMKTEPLIKGMEHHTGCALPASIATLLSEWENEFRAVSLQLAVVLQVKDRHRAVLEQTQALKNLSLAHPAEGIWLLDYRKQEEWQQILSEIGIIHIPRIQGLGPPLEAVFAEEKKSGRIPLPSVWAVCGEEQNLLNYTSKHPHFIQPEALLAEYAQSPAIKQLSESEISVFQERLRRRLILIPEQIKPGAWRQEIITARGLNYQAKFNLAEAAISGRHERLELTIAAETGVETILLIPQSLEKTDTGHILTGVTLPDEELSRYPLRKISLLKRVKMSLL
ncbi:MAG: hypothetical protein B0D92_04175 [Spirochaeta sp. LUC14_002_19_P3]|nr:MAG: hypothetical protein B0D92_04175 [Spirochaeta sp. LUC14_002_19_P3]